MSLLEIKPLIDELQAWMKRAQNAIQALQELESLQGIAHGEVEKAKKAGKKPEPAEPGTKLCNQCEERKPLSEFREKGNQCKACKKEYMRQWYERTHKKASKKSSAGPLPFACETCHAKFSTEEALELHQETKHADE